LKLVDVGAPVEGAPGFDGSSPPVASRDPPHSRPACERTDKSGVDITPSIALARQSQNGVGPDENVAVYGRGEVNSEERIPRIR
jgi:hypothetical protein